MCFRSRGESVVDQGVWGQSPQENFETIPCTLAQNTCPASIPTFEKISLTIIAQKNDLDPMFTVPLEPLCESFL